MAVARVELTWTPDAGQEASILESVHRCLVEELGVPDDDPTVFVRHHPSTAVSAPGWGDRYTVITVLLFAGRTPDTKARLMRRLADSLAAVGVPAADTLVVLQEVPVADWAIGGIPADQTDLGFEVEV